MQNRVRGFMAIAFLVFVILAGVFYDFGFSGTSTSMTAFAVVTFMMLMPEKADG